MAVSPDGIEMVVCPGDLAGMGCVEGGVFVRGTDQAHPCAQGENRRAGTGWGPPEEVWQQTFYMDKTEVTYGAYQACVQSGMCTRSHPAYNDYDRENQPMVGMTWYQARAFCEAEGKHLPTEAEWEKAARGPAGAQGPFGDETVTCEQAVVRDASGRSCGVPKKAPSPEKGRTWEVGQKPVGPYGLYDMVGNAEEWVADWFARDFEACGEACKGTSPKGPCDGAETCVGYDKKMVKGGSWYWGPEHARGWHRRPHFPRNRPYHHFGFRCAATLEEARALLESQRRAVGTDDVRLPEGP
ncbi:MAG: formylglycine-generating enzyme family protein [Myxococcota bacterium]